MLPLGIMEELSLVAWALESRLLPGRTGPSVMGKGEAVPETLYVPANIALALDETHSGRTGPDLGRAGPTLNHSFRTASHQAQKNWP